MSTESEPGRLTQNEHQSLVARWREIDDELAELVAGDLLPGGVDRLEQEAELLGELDEIEFQLGEDWPAVRRDTVGRPLSLFWLQGRDSQPRRDGSLAVDRLPLGSAQRQPRYR